MADDAKRPIVIRRRKAGGHGHHGGAWKVAYADFVTAMMALFIVLWLMGSDEEVKKAIGSYFQDPTGSGTQAGTTTSGSGHAIDVAKAEMSKLREKLEQAMQKAPSFQQLKENIEMTLTADGLRIELLESETGVFFESGRPKPNPVGEELLATLAGQVGKLPNTVSIEGHTDSRPFPGEEYSNWELSSDRANAARRIMEAHGLRREQVIEVRGYADRELRNPKEPDAATNRRISLIVRYQLVGGTAGDQKEAHH